MEDGRVKYTCKSGKIGGAETATSASTLSHNTRNSTETAQKESVDKVGKAEADGEVL